MISVILTILKILGIILLVLLGILLFIVCVIVFVPIRYRAKGIYQEGKANVSGRVTWLLHLLSARIFFEAGQPLHINVRLLGIPVFDNLKRTEKAGKKEKNKKPKKQKTNTELQTASVSDEKTEPSFSQEETVPDNLKTETERKEHSETDASECTKKSVFQKISTFWSKLIALIRNIKYTFQKICDTIVKIKDNIKYYLELLQRESTKAAIATCRTQLKRIFKNLAPQKYQVRLHLGFEDPSTMGEIMAVWGMLYPLHEGRIDIVPEFEQSVIEGDYYLKGRISIYVYIRTLLIVLFDKNIKWLYHQLRRNI